MLTERDVSRWILQFSFLLVTLIISSHVAQAATAAPEPEPAARWAERPPAGAVHCGRMLALPGPCRSGCKSVNPAVAAVHLRAEIRCPPARSQSLQSIVKRLAWLAYRRWRHKSRASPVPAALSGRVSPDARNKWC